MEQNTRRDEHATRPPTVAWAIGLSGLHLLLAVIGFFAAAGHRSGFALIVLLWGIGYAAVIVGLVQRDKWGWQLGVVLLGTSVLIALAHLTISISTSLAVLILLVTPSARAYFTT